jgi:hypothetical protein
MTPQRGGAKLVDREPHARRAETGEGGNRTKFFSLSSPNEERAGVRSLRNEEFRVLNPATARWERRALLGTGRGEILAEQCSVLRLMRRSP